MCVQDICIYGDPTKSYVVALVCPARAAISAMAARFGKSELSFEQLCGDKDITGGVLRDIVIQVTGLAAATTTINEFKDFFLFFCENKNIRSAILRIKSLLRFSSSFKVFLLS